MVPLGVKLRRNQINKLSSVLCSFLTPQTPTRKRGNQGFFAINSRKKFKKMHSRDEWRGLPVLNPPNNTTEKNVIS